MKIKSKMVHCIVCRKKYTINYKSDAKQVKSVCPHTCGKHNVHIIVLKK